MPGAGLAGQVRAGQERAVARAITVVERGGLEAEALLAALRGSDTAAWRVGLTGAPGVGKSSLTQALGLALREEGERVAVLAVDPSSPYSGGALLGDRVRMPELLRRGAFVRSMATRGALGGLSAAAGDALDVLDAAGFPWVLVETVGVGQDEVDVASTVDTVVVVTVAGLGDDIQAAKAGILEIADIFVVNKADRPGAEAQVAALEGMLELQPAGEWRPPVIRASARSGEGIAELRQAIGRHRVFLEANGRRAARRHRQAAERILRLVAALASERVRRDFQAMLEQAVGAVMQGRQDVHGAARRLFASLQGVGAAREA
ncbi:MAG: methylmalonyl Co-A mutase-associated GTPase MeaB [Acidobacteriota bacterium]|jgi:LAO/AO transport system kinase